MRARTISRAGVALLLALGALVAQAPSASADTASLTTTFAGGSGNQAIFFDVSAAAEDLTLTSLSMELQSGAPGIATDIELWARSGTFVGAELSTDGWTKFGAVNVTPGSPGPVPFTVPVTGGGVLVPAGQSAGLVVVAKQLVYSVAYSIGDGTGTVEAFDGRLTIYEGMGSVGFPSNGVNANRIPNVTIDYSYGDAPVVECQGQAATIEAAPGVPTVGTAEDDVIVGTAGDDVISGGGGHDLICALGGADEVSGGNGDDTVYGGEGNDWLKGNKGADLLSGDGGNDRLNGQQHDDALLGGDGDDTLNGDVGTDGCNGDAGTNKLTACEGPVLS